MLRRQLSENAKKVLQLEKLTNEYFEYLISQAVTVVSADEKNYSLTSSVILSTNELRNLESSIDHALNAQAPEDTLFNLKQSKNEKQRIFKEKCADLQIALAHYCSDESVNILNEKINAMHRLNATLDSEKANGEKLKTFRTRLEEENDTLRKHRNKNWDRFFDAVYFVFLPPIFIINSIFNRVNYGTWDPLLTRGDEVVTEANEIITKQSPY